MEEKEIIALSQKQIPELTQIIFDNDKNVAFKFLEEHIYKPLIKRKEGHCKPQV